MRAQSCLILQATFVQVRQRTILGRAFGWAMTGERQNFLSVTLREIALHGMAQHSRSWVSRWMYKNLQQTEHGQNQQGLPSLKYMCGELVAGVGVEPGTQGHLLTERWELVVAGVLMAFVPLL